MNATGIRKGTPLGTPLATSSDPSGLTTGSGTTTTGSVSASPATLQPQQQQSHPLPPPPPPQQQQAKHPSLAEVTSKDASVITTVLKDMGVAEHDPAVVHQLLEFTYRYVSTVLDDAQIFSHYAKKKTIDAEDVRLAIGLQVDKSFTSPPPRDLLLEIARHKNSQVLPPIKSHNGPRLPPDRYSLIVCNYKLKSAPKIKSAQMMPTQTHIQLPFRSSNSILAGLNRNPSLIALQTRGPPTNTYSTNRISVANPIESSNGSDGLKRKRDGNDD